MSKSTMSTPRSSARYRLYYFDVRGRGELIRLLFKAARVPFEDVRVKKEQWATLKKETPFGSLPVLETGGQKFGESGAIVRWAARKFGLDGKSDSDQLRVEAALDQVLDLRNQMIAWHFQQNEEVKSQMRTKLEDNTRTFLTRWEALAKDTQSSGRTYTYLVGTSLTAADLAVLDLLDHLTNILDINLNQYPKLYNNQETVTSIGPIRNYLQSRPHSDL